MELGGGTGLPAVLEGLAELAFEKGETDPHGVTGIVTVTDDGGSSGRLRQQFGVLPPGDARNCLLALTDRDSRFKELLHWKSAVGCADAGHRRLRWCRAYSLDDHLRVIRAHTGFDLFDYVLINRRPVNDAAVRRYAERGSQPVVVDRMLNHAGDAQIVECDLATEWQGAKIRHHPPPLARAIRALVTVGRPDEMATTQGS